MTRIAPIFLALLALSATACGGDAGSQDETQTAARKEEPKSASSETDVKIEDFAWIAGHWRGKAMGGEFEETWNPPLGDSMIGMFKLIKDGKTVFTEIVMLHKVDGRFVMRVKHFDEKFVGWEAKDKSINFPFEKLEKDGIIFDGLRMKRVSNDQLQIVVRVRNGDKIGQIVFDAKRFKRD